MSDSPVPEKPSILTGIYDKTVMTAPWLVVIATLAVTIFFSIQLKDFRLDASSESIVLENDEALRYYDATRKSFGSDDYVVMTITPTVDLFSDEVLVPLKKLHLELEGMPHVASVTSIMSVPLFHSPDVGLFRLATGYKTLMMDDTDRKLAKAEFLSSPLYLDYLISTDGKTSAIQVNYAPNDEYNSLQDRQYELRQKLDEGSLSDSEAVELAAVESQYMVLHAEEIDINNQDVKAVREVIARYSEEYPVFGDMYLGGVPMIIADIISYVGRDIVVFGIGVIIFIFLMMALIFRQVKWVVLPTVTCIVTVLIMMGYMGFTDWSATIVTSNFSSLLMIVTMSMAIHIVVRYRELHAGHPDMSNRELVLSTVRLVAMPCLYTSLTTVVGFGSLIVSGIRPVMDFGMMMAMGLTLAYLLCFLFLPAALLLFPKGKAPPKGLAELKTSPLQVFANFTRDHPGMVAVMAVVCFGFFGFGITRLTVENRFIDYFHKDSPIYQGMTVIDNRLGGTTPLEIILEAGPGVIIAEVEGADEETAKQIAVQAGANDIEFEDGMLTITTWPRDLLSIREGLEARGAKIHEASIHPIKDYWITTEGLAHLRKVHNHLDSLPETGKVLSLDTMNLILTKILKGTPPTEGQLKLIRSVVPDEIKRAVLTPYVNADFSHARIAMRARESSHDLNRKELLANIRKYLDEEAETDKIKAEYTGMFILYNNMLQSLVASQVKTIGAVVVAIWLMFLILFRSLKLASIAIVPNVLPVAVVLGTLGWLGIPLDMMTVMIAAVTFGIAVDDTIHYIHRFQHEFTIDGDYVATMSRCHNSIGRAMFYTTVTIVAGFSILSFSNFIPTIYFGLFTGFAMIMALLAAMTLLPMLIIAIKPLGPGKAG